MRLIDADKLMENVLKWMPPDPCGQEELEYPFEEDICASMIMQIDLMPTVDAELVRHGKFIGTEYDGYADGYPVYCEWECSECGCVFEDEEPTYNYCPYCGAKLDNSHCKPCDDCQEFDCYGCKYVARREE